jgi:colanic acid biosynthesis glycosyl transferase WcaI
MTMRIVLVGPNYSPEVVGIGPYTTELAEHLAASGHAVTVLTSFPYYPHWRIEPSYRRKGPFLAESTNGVRVVRSPMLLPGNRPSTFRRVLFDSSQALSALMASAGIGAVDLVICVAPPLQLGVTAWLIAVSRGARLVLQLQDIVPDAALSVGMMHEGNLIRLSRQLERFVYSRAQLIAVISQGFADNLMSKGVPEPKLRVLPNWVETARFGSGADPKVRAALGAADGETLVIHAGNMGAKQGLETVVDAAAELVDERIVMALVGDGNNRTALEARASRVGPSNLRFFPIQTDLPATLAAADVLVLAQRGKVVDSVAPSKLLSYMAAGKPIIASVNELSEAGRMIRRAKCGVVVPPEEPKALAAALRELHGRPEDWPSLGVAGRRHVAEHYERSDVLGQWSKLVEAQEER